MKNRYLLALFLACTLPYLSSIGSANAWVSGYDWRMTLTQTDGLADPFLAGDQCYTINGTLTCVYCANTSAYFYYNNATGSQVTCADSLDAPTRTQVRNVTGIFNIGGNPFDSSRYIVVVPCHNDSGIDASAIPYAVTKADAPYTLTGKVGSACYFDGTNDAFSYGDIADGDGMSVMYWARLNATPANGRYHMGQGTAPDPRWWVDFDTRWFGRWRDASGDYLYIDTGKSSPSQLWTFLSYNVSGTTGHGMINGTHEGTATDATMSYPGTGNTFYIGSTDGTNFADISLDEIRILNKTISVDESYAHWCNEESTCSYSTAGTPEQNVPANVVTIFLPENTTYPQNATFPLTWSFNASFGSPCDTAFYSYDGAANVTLAGCGNVSIDLGSNGAHEVRIFANDTAGNAASDVEYFTVDSPILYCNDSQAVRSVNFTFYDEVSLALMNGSAEYALEIVASGFTYNWSVTNVTEFSICIVDNSTQVVDMTMLYRYSGYEQRTYYFYRANLTSSLTEISLYQITQALGEKLEITTKDTDDNTESDVYVDIDRYYPATDSYRTVAIGRSDGVGQILTYVELDDTFYRFTLSQSGVVVNTYTDMVITDTTEDPELLTLYIGAQETQFFQMRETVGYTCFFNTTTNNTVCSVTDSSGLVVLATLTVERASLTGFTDVCTDTGSGASFTLTCNLGANPTGTYRYALVINPDVNPDYTLLTGIIEFATVHQFGDYGLFMAWILVLVAGLLAVMTRSAGILVVIALGGASLMGLIDVGITSIVSLACVAVLIFIKGRGV